MMKNHKFRINGKAIGESIIYLIVFLSLFFIDYDVPDFGYAIVMLGLIILFGKLFIDSMGGIFQYD